MLSTKLEYSNNLVNGNKIVISFFFMQSLCKLVCFTYVSSPDFFPLLK